MLVYMQASGLATIRIEGGVFNSIRFAPENMGPCNIQALGPNQIQIAGAKRHFIWEIDFVRDPFKSLCILATTDRAAALCFTNLPNGGYIRVPPDHTDIEVYAEDELAFHHDLLA